MAQINSKRKLKIKDIIEFGWDTEKKQTAAITVDERERMLRKMRETEKLKNDGKK